MFNSIDTMEIYMNCNKRGYKYTNNNITYRYYFYKIFENKWYFNSINSKSKSKYFIKNISKNNVTSFDSSGLNGYKNIFKSIDKKEWENVHKKINELYTEH